MNARASATSDVIERQVGFQSSLDWPVSKMRLPLVMAITFLLSSIFGMIWAFLHINTKVVRYVSWIKLHIID